MQQRFAHQYKSLILFAAMLLGSGQAIASKSCAQKDTWYPPEVSQSQVRSRTPSDIPNVDIENPKGSNLARHFHCWALLVKDDALRTIIWDEYRIESGIDLPAGRPYELGGIDEYFFKARDIQKVSYDSLGNISTLYTPEKGTSSFKYDGKMLLSITDNQNIKTTINE